MLKLDGRKMRKQVVEGVKVYFTDRVDIEEVNFEEIKDEIEYHELDYGQKPEKIYFLQSAEFLLEETDKDYSKDIAIITQH